MIHFTEKFFDHCAAWLLVVIAGTAPWFAGAQPAISLTGWWYVAGLAGSLVLVLASCILRRELLRVPRTVLWPVGFLLGCVAWWATQPDPAFATIFSAEQWAALKILLPGGFIDTPRGLRLAMAAAVLLGLVSAAHLGADRRFRLILMLIVGWSGVAVGGYSLCERLLQWDPPTWIIKSDGPERYNAAFFHYSCVAACVNLAWPFLVFPCRRPIERTTGRLGFWAGVVAVAGTAPLAIALWPTEAAKWIAAGLALFGGAWYLMDRFTYVSPKIIGGTVIVGFIVLLFVQALYIQVQRKRYNDGWRSAAATLAQSPMRDAQMSAMAAKRGDRLIPAKGGDRPAGWLATLRMIADRPFFGDGPGTRARLLGLYTNQMFVNSFNLHLQFAHHDLLQTAAEWGLLPLVCWLAVWLTALCACIVDAANSRAVFLALLGVALHGLVDFPLQVPGLQMWTALLLGLAVASRETLPRPKRVRAL